MEDNATASSSSSSSSLEVTKQDPLAVEAKEVQPKRELTLAQKAQMERNRQKALLIRQAKTSKRTIEEAIALEAAICAEGNGKQRTKRRVVERPAPVHVFSDEKPVCIDCERTFVESELLVNFDYPVCDACKKNDEEGEYDTMIKTDAMRLYLLKDVDLSKREPPLKFVEKVNSRSQFYAPMKLYLATQVQKRALEVWGSAEAIEDEKIRRKHKLASNKAKKVERNIENKRKKTYRLEKAKQRLAADYIDRQVHKHDFGVAIHIEEDNWKDVCKTCGLVREYERM